MAAPYFYFATLASQKQEFALNENSSRHVVLSLRMQPGEQLQLTDGKGLSALATIREANKKRCLIEVTEKKMQDAPVRKITVALSLLKNTSRFEWFLEKATELGISEIVPLRCTRTEKQQFRVERMMSILESAMIQSQQVWMPVMQEPQEILPWLNRVKAEQCFIAHCEPGLKRNLSELINIRSTSQLILIGPEGDFTEEEIQLALQNEFVGVELGSNRLRSETAAIAAASVLKLVSWQKGFLED